MADGGCNPRRPGPDGARAAGHGVLRGGGRRPVPRPSTLPGGLSLTARWQAPATRGSGGRDRCLGLRRRGPVGRSSPPVSRRRARGARDTLRLEAGLLLPSRARSASPCSRPAWAGSWPGPSRSYGAATLVAERAAGVTRHLVGIAILGPPPTPGRGDPRSTAPSSGADERELLTRPRPRHRPGLRPRRWGRAPWSPSTSAAPPSRAPSSPPPSSPTDDSVSDAPRSRRAERGSE